MFTLKAQLFLFGSIIAALLFIGGELRRADQDYKQTVPKQLTQAQRQTVQSVTTVATPKDAQLH